jgi:hypothetical protein
VSDLVYLYGFVPAPFAASTEPLAGIGGRAVELLEIDGVNAIVSRVDANEYGSERVESRLQDLAWVAEQGVAHERVVAWFVDRTQILPASLFTLYSSPSALKKSAQAQQETIVSELKRLDGQREWDLKVAYDTALLARHAVRYSDQLKKLEDELTTAAPGKKYLLERKRGELNKKEVGRIAREQAQQIVDAVRPLSTEVRSLPIPQSAEELPVVLHAALLVHRDQEAKVIRQIEQARKESDPAGFSISFSGPWAPYRFVQHERSA